jgi:hypothetical protein
MPVKQGPYGRTNYADPGYQPDHKPRYPLSNSERVHAAWTYINRKAYAERYTRKQLEIIHQRIQVAGRKYGMAFGHARQRRDRFGRFT